MDIDHYWGGDLQVSATGDLALVSGNRKLEQRILRRLLTTRYVWHPDYGAALQTRIGSLARTREIEALIVGDVQKEEGIAPQPQPSASLTQITDGYEITIQFHDAATQTPRTLRFQVNR